MMSSLHHDVAQTPRSWDSCATIRTAPWQGRPDSESKGDSIRERNDPEESIRTAGVTLPVKMLPQD